MGRAGSSHHVSHSHSSSSHRVNTRSSSSHRPSSGRAGSYHSSAGTHRAGQGSTYHYSRLHRRGYHTYSPARSLHTAVFVPTVVITVFTALLMLMVLSDVSGDPRSSYSRTPLEGVAWDNDCIVDETGWVANIGKASRNLKYFYEKTGVQPFVYLKAYDPALTSDAEKEAYAEDWYDAHISNEGTFLFVYFGERNLDDDVGMMTVVNGREVSSVMDAEATDIFWNYVDRYWYSSMSTEDMLAAIYDHTADTIMTKSTTPNDILRIVLYGAIILIAALFAFLVVKHILFAKAEQEERYREILETPVEELKTDSELLDKYSEKEGD